MNFNSNEEKEYYELLADLLENGEISDSERNILNKRKEKYSISDSRANEIEEFAKEERFENLKPQNDSENSYYELILDFMENGEISENNRKILIKRMEKYGISDKRAKELEDFARNENIEKQNIANNLFEQGKSYYQNGEYEKAIESFSKVVELDPKNDENWHWLGIAYNMVVEFDKAKESLLKAVELNPNDAVSWYWLGEALEPLGEIKEAKNAYMKALEINPYFELARNKLKYL